MSSSLLNDCNAWLQQQENGLLPDVDDCRILRDSIAKHLAALEKSSQDEEASTIIHTATRHDVVRDKARLRYLRLISKTFDLGTSSFNDSEHL